MTSVSITLYSNENDTSFTLSKCVNLHFEKERYTPYTTATGIFVCEFDTDFISKVRIFLNEKGVHYGPIDSFEHYKEGGISYIKFSSRGFSMGLSQNQPMPGMNLNVNLQSLIDQNITIPYVTCEADTEVANYIFVKESSSLWDAVVALGQKVEGTYPYIEGENEIRLSKKDTEAFDISSFKVTKEGFGVKLLNVVSDYHMKDTEDAYSYNYTNNVAADYEIVRHKYINLDRQWLSDPDSGLMHKGKFSGKGIKYSYLKVAGYCPVDLRQSIILSETEKELSRFSVDFNKNGFFTTLWFYEDGYTA